jgi:hypothetical protein
MYEIAHKIKADDTLYRHFNEIHNLMQQHLRIFANNEINFTIILLINILIEINCKIAKLSAVSVDYPSLVGFFNYKLKKKGW